MYVYGNMYCVCTRIMYVGLGAGCVYVFVHAIHPVCYPSCMLSILYHPPVLPLCAYICQPLSLSTSPPLPLASPVYHLTRPRRSVSEASRERENNISESLPTTRDHSMSFSVAHTHTVSHTAVNHTAVNHTAVNHTVNHTAVNHTVNHTANAPQVSTDV